MSSTLDSITRGQKWEYLVLTVAPHESLGDARRRLVDHDSDVLVQLVEPASTGAVLAAVRIARADITVAGTDEADKDNLARRQQRLQH